MTSPGFGRQIDLDEGTAMHLDDARGTTVRVNRGQLWITQHHDLRDIVLMPGDTWVVERNGLTIAAAQRDSSVALVGPGAAQVDHRGRRLHWTERVAAWLERLDMARIGTRQVPYV
jgi:hypothetical protein